jgi:hypothetical protein
MTERQAIDLLIKNKGEVLAGTGWEGYLAAGRGFLVSDGQNVGYFPARLAVHFPSVLRRRVQRLVKSYQPERELVVLLSVLFEGKIMLALGKRTPALTPEEAFLKHAGTPGMPSMQPVYFPEVPHAA